MKWLKHFVWFLWASRDFLDCSLFSVIKQGGIKKAIGHADDMVIYEKLTPEQKQRVYLMEDRSIDL